VSNTPKQYKLDRRAEFLNRSTNPIQHKQKRPSQGRAHPSKPIFSPDAPPDPSGRRAGDGNMKHVLGSDRTESRFVARVAAVLRRDMAMTNRQTGCSYKQNGNHRRIIPGIRAGICFENGYPGKWKSGLSLDFPGRRGGAHEQNKIIS
jgi:hypothetical protein